MEEHELPDGWVRTTLGQISKVNPGLNVSTMSNSILVSFVPMAAVGAGTGHIDVSNTRPLGEVKRGYTAFQNEDVLFAKITPCMENGKAAIAHSLSSNIGFGSTEFHVLRPETNINSQFIYYYVSQELVRQHARTYMTGTAGQLRVPSTFLVEVSFPLAPLPEQQRIVAAIEQQFTRLDAGVAALKSAKTRLRRYRAAVLKAAVEGKLTEAWRAEHPTSEPASQLLTRILQERRVKWEADLRAKGKDPAKVKYVEPAAPDVNGLTELPEGWCWTSLASLTSNIGDVDHKMPKAVSSGIPYISTKDFYGENDINFQLSKRISLEDYTSLIRKIKPESGDILLSRYGTVGEVRKVPANIMFQTSYSIAIVKTLPSLNLTDFLVLALKSDTIQTQIRRDIRASAQPDLGLEYIRQFAFLLPPFEEQQQIVLEVERRLSVVSQLEALVEANLKRAERLRQSVLKEAFAGRLVPQDPDDEPASVLLERIRQEREATGNEHKGRKQSKQQRANSNTHTAREQDMFQEAHVRNRIVEQEPEPIDEGELAQVALWNAD